MITHYDLFAGIGGFSLALEEVFDEPIRHIFCEWEFFPTAVLKQHWPDGEFWGDIADLVAYTDSKRSGTQRHGNNAELPKSDQKPEGQPQHRANGHSGFATNSAAQRQQGQRELARPLNSETSSDRQTSGAVDLYNFSIVTGGFPCQPFSTAGRRKGTSDDRYKWPEMFKVIQNVKPEWVIAENVRGLVTWNEGMVLEQVCTDLESEGYEVQPFIIPAVAVNAPHRRDRVWIIAHTVSNTNKRPLRGVDEEKNGIQKEHRQERSRTRQSVRTATMGSQRSSDGLQDSRSLGERTYPDWNRNWQEVAFATCDDTMDDGLSRLVDGIPYSRPKWRKDSLKAYGNGIVPQVAIEIFKAIKENR